MNRVLDLSCRMNEREGDGEPDNDEWKAGGATETWRVGDCCGTPWYSG